MTVEAISLDNTESQHLFPIQFDALGSLKSERTLFDANYQPSIAMRPDYVQHTLNFLHFDNHTKAFDSSGFTRFLLVLKNQLVSLVSHNDAFIIYCINRFPDRFFFRVVGFKIVPLTDEISSNDRALVILFV